MRRASLAVGLIVMMLPWARGIPSSAGPVRAPASSGSAADFNGDGFADLAIGVIGETVGDAFSAGAVNVLYGSAGGLSSAGNQFWSQDSPGVEGEAGDIEFFGWALATADFDGDGFSDLAVAVPYDYVGGTTAGAVNVLYGTPEGLSTDRSQYWNQDSPGILDDPEYFETFGYDIGAADFNGDGFGDLAVGVPGETIDTEPAGAVSVIYGSATGLSAAGNQLWSQGSDGIRGGLDGDDDLGLAVTTGDFNGDGFGDLVAGDPSETVGGAYGAGAVNVIYGSPAGLSAAGNQIWSQDSPDILDQAEGGDSLGWSVGSGDFNGDGISDLVAGAYNETVGRVRATGAVNVIYGSLAGLTPDNNQFWSQDTPGVRGHADDSDRFSWSVAAGDLDGDGFGDLVVGIPLDGNGWNRGGVNVIYGTADGLSATGSQLWTQNSPGVKERAENTDEFGDAVAVHDFDGDGFADLAVGVHGDDQDGPHHVDAAGVVNVLYGSRGGLKSVGNQLWSQDSPKVLDVAELDDYFSEDVG
jgi:hypothetical protein